MLTIRFLTFVTPDHDHFSLPVQDNQSCAVAFIYTLHKSILMKKLSVMVLGIFLMLFSVSCKDEKDDPTVLTGDPSPMGEVGTTTSSSSMEIAGVSNFTAVVTDRTDGISTYSGSATVTNTLLKNMVANFPGVTIDGDQVSITGMQMQSTTEGIKCLTGPGAGVLVKYDSNVGDTYPIGSTGEVRTVVSKTGVDDYPYGFYLIKTIQVESNPGYVKSAAGVSKITYIANHKFGLVGVKLDYEDGTSSTFPVYSTTTN
ncbi:MAG: hypothetical protein FD166_861 [Bacteroidetes bacterium]|nr:MAG: hypothetical protein FD166_861 [Bacteroidota bacterium]